MDPNFKDLSWIKTCPEVEQALADDVWIIPLLDDKCKEYGDYMERIIEIGNAPVRDVTLHLLNYGEDPKIYLREYLSAHLSLSVEETVKLFEEELNKSTRNYEGKGCKICGNFVPWEVLENKAIFDVKVHNRVAIVDPNVVLAYYVIKGKRLTVEIVE